METGLECNIWCRNYSKCLDQAVRTGERFSCADCEFRNNHDGKDEIFMFGYYLLLAAIFFPGAYREFREDKKREELSGV